jgi:hypothetical protein
LSIVPKGQENERRVQLASVRGPRGNEGKQQYYANEAKEWVSVCLDRISADWKVLTKASRRKDSARLDRLYQAQGGRLRREGVCHHHLR